MLRRIIHYYIGTLNDFIIFMFCTNLKDLLLREQ